MKQLNEESNDRLDSLIEHVYAATFWAFEAGATKEELLEQLEAAFECVSAIKMDFR